MLRGLAGMLWLSAMPLQAQFTLEVLDGTGWGSHLSLTTLVPMNFRWKWEGRSSPGTVSWQITFTSPASVSYPTIVKQGTVTLPAVRQEYATFQISPSEVPGGAPSRFYVRLRGLSTNSSWIEVFVGQRVTSTLSSPSGPVLGPLPPPPPPPPPPPFTIPGGAGSILETPLWIKMTRIFCDITTDDGNPSDEVYAIAVAVDLNRQQPSQSKVLAYATSVYDDMDAGDYRAPNLSVWGTPDGLAFPIRDPHDAIVLILLVESDGHVTPLIAAAMAQGAVMNRLKAIPAGADYGALVADLSEYIQRGVHSVIIYGGVSGAGNWEADDFVGSPTHLPVSEGELSAARAGTIVKKTMTVAYPAGSGIRGRYSLRFQLGKAGLSTVPW